MKKAFTLAEVLVAVAIAGVISAFMLMQINKNNVQQNILLYKKTFTNLQDIVSNIAGDTRIFPLPEHGMKYSIGADESEGKTNDINGAKNAQYLCQQITNRLITDKYKVKSGANVRDVNCGDGSKALKTPTDDTFKANTNITLTNGTVIAGLGQVFTITSNDQKNNFIDDYIDLCIDTNGDKAPNKGCISNNTGVDKRDRFRIRIYFNGKVTTDSTWKFENEILYPSGSTMDLKSKDFEDDPKS